MLRAPDTTLDWRRSSYCADKSCVEIAVSGDEVLLRDSKAPSRPPLRLDAAAWRQFTEDIKADHF
ncbi:DUF397 domain-containing protein [Actinoplanes sp. M2I2]|uniref:DUF397 domain-containing protein n=1 Tax=Actinoplanes sp. M2I2 TaxID=1734444 RepID=UPI00202276B0|nr:DUF397 domain-containing protein [Actinoplanes sp. M2I2]